MKMFAARTIARWVGACLAAALVAGCGGGSSSNSGTASLRLVNASAGYGLLDLYVDSSLAQTSVSSGSASPYIMLSAGTHTTALTRSGSDATLQSQDRTLAGDATYAVVAYGWEGQLKTFHLTENEAAPDSGKAKLRTVNTAPDAGTLDVYVTGPTDSLSDASPVNAGVAGSSLSSYATITQGTYRIRVTAAGDKTDLRLDIPSVALASQEVASLILTPTSGGVLVNGLLLQQQSDAVAYTNTYARARLVADATGNATVSASIGGVLLSSGARSPVVGNYALVPTGLLPLDVKVNGVAASAGNASATAGADLTLLVHGDPAAAQVTVLNDDNRLPSSVTGAASKARVRIVHGVSSLADSGLSLVADFSALADDVPYASASAYGTLASGSQQEIDVTSPLSSNALYSATDLSLQSDAVYTVFMLNGASAPVGVLRKDR